MKESEFKLDVEEIPYCEVLNRMPREVVDVASLVVFKAKLDRALSNLM